MCGGSYQDDYSFALPSMKQQAIAEKDDRIKKAVPKDQPLSKSAVRTDGSLKMQSLRKPQFA